MEQIKFVIPGKPFGKQRPRMTKAGMAYTPKETTSYENLIKRACQDSKGGLYFDAEQPVGLGIKAYYPIPASTSKRARNDMLEGRLMPTKKPDCDNIAKIVADALNGIAYYDDKQIVVNIVEKCYSEEPRVEVTIWPIRKVCEAI
jgi:Holliday junction resolvase RusA-like endonuclease